MHGPRETVAASGGRQIVLMDSISYATPDDHGVFAVSGSHGGKSSGEITSGVPVAGAVFNDAGVGKERAGIAGLATLDKKGVPAIAVSYESARIGDARDTWQSGIISHANGAAEKAGIKVGARVEDALRGWLEKAG
jgi:hypothetical protein